MNSKSWISIPIFLLVWGLMVLSLYSQAEIYVYLVLGLGALYQLYTWSFNKRALGFMLSVGLFGWFIESIESHFEVLKVMGKDPQPLWMVLLWAYYVSVTFSMFTKYVNRYWKAFLYGASSLPGSYYLVARVDIAEIGTSVPLFFLINGTVGGLVLMFACLMYYSLGVDKL